MLFHSFLRVEVHYIHLKSPNIGNTSGDVVHTKEGHFAVNIYNYLVSFDFCVP